jgi:AraC family transcriptional regulator of arabinose operon
VLLRPGTLHDYGVAEGYEQWELLWAHFDPRPHWMELLDWPQANPGLLFLSLGDAAARSAIERRFGEVHELATGAMRRREDLAMNALEEVLLRCDGQRDGSGRRPVDARVRATMDWLCRNVGEKITLGRAARAAGLSVSRLTHLFSEQTGTSPREFLERQRLTRATQLLEVTSRPIKEIAHEVGYENPLYFSLRFKKFSGMSPRKYRRR